MLEFKHKQSTSSFQTHVRILFTPPFIRLILLLHWASLSFDFTSLMQFYTQVVIFTAKVYQSEQQKHIKDNFPAKLGGVQNTGMTPGVCSQYIKSEVCPHCDCIRPQHDSFHPRRRTDGQKLLCLLLNCSIIYIHYKIYIMHTTLSETWLGWKLDG